MSTPLLTLPELLRHFIACERHQPSPLPEDVVNAGLPMPNLPTGDRKTRKQLRLLIGAVRDTLLINPDPNIESCAYVLKRIRIPSGRRQAAMAMQRFCVLLERAMEAATVGTVGGQPYRIGAELATLLLSDYNGSPHDRSLSEVADWVVEAIYPDVDTTVFRNLMRDLEALEK